MTMLKETAAITADGDGYSWSANRFLSHSAQLLPQMRQSLDSRHMWTTAKELRFQRLEPIKAFGTAFALTDGVRAKGTEQKEVEKENSYGTQRINCNHRRRGAGIGIVRTVATGGQDYEDHAQNSRADRKRDTSGGTIPGNTPGFAHGSLHGVCPRN